VLQRLQALKEQLAEDGVTLPPDRG